MQQQKIPIMKIVFLGTFQLSKIMLVMLVPTEPVYFSFNSIIIVFTIAILNTTQKS